MSNEITKPVRLFYDAYAARHDTDAALDAFTDSTVVHWQSQTLDIAGYRQVGLAFLAGFPDLSYHMDEQFVADGRVITRGIWSGTNTGSLMGMPVTGKRFSSVNIVIDHVVDGRIIERWEVGDILGMMQQLGLAPTP